MGLLDCLLAHRADVLRLTVEHIGLVAVAMLFAVVCGVPLGILAARHRRLGRLALAAANAVQTVPSLALFGFLIPVPFVGGRRSWLFPALRSGADRPARNAPASSCRPPGAG